MWRRLKFQKNKSRANTEITNRYEARVCNGQRMRDANPNTPGRPRLSYTILRDSHRKRVEKNHTENTVTDKNFSPLLSIRFTATQYTDVCIRQSCCRREHVFSPGGGRMFSVAVPRENAYIFVFKKGKLRQTITVSCKQYFFPSYR